MSLPQSYDEAKTRVEGPIERFALNLEAHQRLYQHQTLRVFRNP